MNEQQLKIIIEAVTEAARNEINKVKKELQGVSTEAKNTSGKFGTAMKGMAKTAAIAVAAIAAVGAAVIALGKNTLESQKRIAQLNSAFQAAGKTTTEAANVYKNFYRFLGDEDTSTEASNLLIKLTQNEKDLVEWTKTLQGVYATFPSSLPIEGLVESANETARVGKITGNLADALVWAGVSEDEFNSKLAQTTSYEQREALIRSTLNDLYGKAAENYEKNNKAILEYNESQAKLQNSMAAAGAVVTPLLTALSNLGSVLMQALKPALEVIIPPLVTVVNWLTQGIQAVMGFFSSITGSSSSVKTSVESAASGISNAASGTNNLTTGLDNAAKAAEKVKRATMGFDELNVVSSDSSGSSSSGSGGSSGPSYMNPQFNGLQFNTQIEETEKKTNGFVNALKKIGEELKKVFEPTITAWTKGFETIKESWNKSKDNFKLGALDIKDSLKSITTYIFGDFIPNIINSFSTNLAPMITDVLGFAIKEISKLFKDFGYITKDITDNVIIPAFNVVKGIVMDVFQAIGDAWAKHGQPLMDELSKFMEHIRGIVLYLYNDLIKPILNKLTATIKDVWENSLKDTFRKIIDAVMEIGRCILELYNKFLAPVVEWIIKNIVPVVRKIINDGVQKVGEAVKLIGKLIGEIVDIIKGIVQFITGVFTGDWKKAWEGIKNIFGSIWDAIVALFKNSWENIKNTWSKVGNFFGGVVNGIKNAFSGIADWFGNIFTKAWTAVKNVFSKGGKVFDGIKDGILNGLKTVVNALIKGINKVISVPFNGLNTALSKIKNVSILGAKPFNWIKTIGVPQIPLLAKGGIVDSATLAMIGEKGKEAVIPLENNTAWMDKLAEKLAARNETPTRIVLQIDGRELGWANIKSINDITRQTGTLQLNLM